VDLFKNVLEKPEEELKGLDKLIDHAPICRILFFWRDRRSAAEIAGVKDIYEHVVEEFRKIGRVAQSGKHMLDSIAKDDLLKVLGKAPVAELLPNFPGRVASAIAQIQALEKELESVKAAAQSGAASGHFDSISAEYASIEVALKPLFNDIKTIVDAQKITVPGPAGSAAPAPSAKLLIRDIADLRRIDPDEVLKLLGAIQSTITTELATVPPGTPVAAAMGELAGGLAKIADGITDIRGKLDAAVVPLKAKVDEIGTWYDTVMQSFEERYNRSMKTWAIVVAFLVVAVLDADLFNIYRNVAANGVLSKALAEQAPDILKRIKERTEEAQTQPAQATLSPQDLKTGIDQLKGDVGSYLDVGFAPITWQQVKNWVATLSPSKDWLQYRKADVKTLLGWIIMAMLLSIGAPFWQDMLESLFGVKNLLRKKGDIKNVESESGAGQPKT
jgi:hypothetical protein